MANGSTETMIEIDTTTESEAAELTAKNQHGHVYEHGLAVIIDDQAVYLKSREDCDRLITRLQASAENLWPDRTDLTGRSRYFLIPENDVGLPAGYAPIARLIHRSTTLEQAIFLEELMDD